MNIGNEPLKISVVSVISFNLAEYGTMTDSYESPNPIFANYSAKLLDDKLIEKELDCYIDENKLESFEIDHLDELTDIIYKKHIKNVNSEHSKKHAKSILRQSV